MFKHLSSIVFGTVVVLAAGAASAQPSDIEAKAQICGACHGANGAPTDPKTMPIIWGQQPNYILKQLHNYKTGERENPIMAAIARGLDLKDLRPMAAYFAAKPWPARPAGAPAAGAAPAGIAQCQACHQQNFEGGPAGPRLAGLSYEYLVASMRSFATDQRINNTDMPRMMKLLSESERDAMARYVAGL
jgi:cytochrome c553